MLLQKLKGEPKKKRIQAKKIIVDLEKRKKNLKFN